MDVSKFAYRLGIAGLNTVFTDSEPIVRFAPDDRNDAGKAHMPSL